MQFYRRIRELHIEKRKGFIFLFIIELILLIIAFLGLFGKNAVYEYGIDDMTVRFGSYSDETGGIYADPSGKRTGTMVDFENIELPRGKYYVCLKYETDTNMKNSCTVSDVTLGYKTLLTNGDLLYQGLDQTDFEMWLFRGTKQLIVHTSYEGQGSMTIRGLTIYETNELARMDLFVLVLFIIAANSLYTAWAYDKAYGISVEAKSVAFGLFITIIFASLPVLTDYLVSTGDTTFHLWRIEGMKEGLLTGQLPVRISAKWQYGYGYAAPIFYGETFLWPAALLRMIGFSIDISYRIYLVLLSAATVLSAYYCFKRILGSRYMGLFSSALYSISIYRIHKVYTRGTLGEAIAMMLTPILAYGFYKVFAEDVNEPGYRFNYVPLVIGFSGLLQSHLLTGEMAGAFTILLCLIMWKKVFRIRTFLVLAKTVAYSLLVSAWFAIPFADYMLTGDFMIQHASGRRIQERGIYPAQLLRTFFNGGGNVHFADTGMYLSDAVGVGMALTAVFGIWIALRFFGYTGQMDSRERNTGRVLAFLSGISMIASLSMFPWDRIQFLNGATATLVSSLEFPDRLLTAANLCLSLLAGIIGKYILGKKRLWKAAYFGGTLVLLMCGSLYLMNNLLYSTKFARIYNEEGMGFGYVSSGEYLPYGTDISKLTFRAPSGDGIILYDYDREGLKLDIRCKNTMGEEGEMEVPLLYYKGYNAFDKATGERLAVYSGENSAVTVRIPADFEGEIEVKFISPWYWRLAEIVSLLTVAGFMITRFVCAKGSAEMRKKCGNV